MEAPNIRIIVVDDHQIFIEGLKAVLSKAEVLHCEVVAEAYTGNSLLRMDKTQADLLLLDMNLPDMDGLEVLASLKEQKSPLKIIVLSMYDEPKIVRAAFKFGADGYLLKSNHVSELYECIQSVMNGNTYMSKGFSFTNGSGAHSRFMQEGKLIHSYEDRFIKKFNLTKRELEAYRAYGEATSI
ncbi:MAG: response regulator transcription factor, partial [Bacteroidota bacterium]